MFEPGCESAINFLLGGRCFLDVYSAVKTEW
jgi:hypothetical protein